MVSVIKAFLRRLFKFRQFFVFVFWYYLAFLSLKNVSRETFFRKSEVNSGSLCLCLAICAASVWCLIERCTEAGQHFFSMEKIIAAMVVFAEELLRV